MDNGTVKFFNDSKGFGFITPDAGGKDVFVHVNGLTDEIREGDKVEYDVEEGPNGVNATNVKVVSVITTELIRIKKAYHSWYAFFCRNIFSHSTFLCYLQI